MHAARARPQREKVKLRKTEDLHYLMILALYHHRRRLFFSSRFDLFGLHQQKSNSHEISHTISSENRKYTIYKRMQHICFSKLAVCGALRARAWIDPFGQKQRDWEREKTRLMEQFIKRNIIWMNHYKRLFHSKSKVRAHPLMDIRYTCTAQSTCTHI